MGKAWAAALFACVALVSPAAADDDGKNRVVVVENRTNETLRELYASPITGKTWEEDLLGDKTLVSNSSIKANISNGTSECRYDLKAVMASKREVVRRDINVCAISKWVIRQDGDSVE